MFKTLTIFFCACLCISSAHATEASDYISGELISSTKNTRASVPLHAGLSLKLVDGWYTYWRMAGDNGLPPKFDWAGSSNIKDVKIHWPVPARYTLMDMHSFGYSGDVLFPLDITPEDSGAETVLNLKMDVIVCHEICIPQTLNFSHVVGKGPDSTSVIEKSLKNIPSANNTERFGMNAAVLSKEAVVVTAFAKDGFAEGVDLILETESPLLFSPPEVILDKTNPDTAILKIQAPQGMDLTKELFGKKANILLIYKGQAIEQEFTF